MRYDRYHTSESHKAMQADFLKSKVMDASPGLKYRIGDRVGEYRITT